MVALLQHCPPHCQHTWAKSTSPALTGGGCPDPEQWVQIGNTMSRQRTWKGAMCDPKAIMWHSGKPTRKYCLRGWNLLQMVYTGRGQQPTSWLWVSKFQANTTVKPRFSQPPCIPPIQQNQYLGTKCSDSWLLGWDMFTCTGRTGKAKGSNPQPLAHPLLWYSDYFFHVWCRQYHEDLKDCVLHKWRP